MRAHPYEKRRIPHQKPPPRERMQPAFVVLFVAIVAIACAETVRHRLVKSCDPRLCEWLRLPQCAASLQHL